MPEGISEPIGFGGQVAAILRLGILDGTYLAGNPLPTQAELAERHGISEATVNRAFSALAREGLVTTGSGRRTVVNRLATYTVTVKVNKPETAPAPAEGWRAAARKATEQFPAVELLSFHHRRLVWEWIMTVRSSDPGLAVTAGLSAARRVTGPGWDFAHAFVQAEPVR